MQALPASLEPLIPRTRQALLRGWRPALTPGPDAGELVKIIS